MAATSKVVFPCVGPAVWQATRRPVWMGGTPTWTTIELATKALLWMADLNPIVGGATILDASEKVSAYSTEAIAIGVSDISIQFKIKPGASHSATIYSYVDGSDYILVQIVSNRLYVDMEIDGVSAAGYVSAAALTASTWYDVVLNCDRSGVLTCYLNTVAQSSDTLDISGLSASFTNSSPTQLIGATSAGVGHLTANLEYLRVRVGGLLSETNISWLHNGGNGRTSADLALIGDEPYMDVDFNRPDTSLADYPPIDRSGNTDWIFVASNMLANPGFETLGAGGADVFANWTESTSGASTIHAETVDVDAGTYSLRMDVSATTSSVSARQSILTIGNTYDWSVRAKISDTTATRHIYNPVSYTSGTQVAITDAWATYNETSVAADANFYLFRGSDSASDSIYFDTVSCLAATVGIANGSAVSSVLDSGPLGNDGVLSGMGIDAFSTDVPSVPDCEGGLSLLFDGVDDYVALPAGAVRSGCLGATGITVSMWLKPDSLVGTAYNSDRLFYAHTANASSLFLSINGDGADALKITAGGRSQSTDSFQYVLSSDVITLGEWNHIAAVYDYAASTIEIFINGVSSGGAQAVTFGSSVYNPATSTYNDRIGYATDLSNGRRDNVRVDATALTAPQALALAAGDPDDPNYPPDSGIKLLIGFDDFSMGLPDDNEPVLAWQTYGDLRAMVRQAEPTSRPAFRTTGVGGRACLEFGGDDSLSVAIPASLNTSENGTLDFVINADSTGTDEVLCSLSLRSADDTFVTIVLNGGELEFTYSDAGTVRSLATTTASLQAETDYAIRFTSDGSTISCFISGTEYALSGDQPGSWFDSLSLDTLTFGACVLSTGTTGFYEGRIAFISLATEELTADEKAELDLYLTNRYRL